MRNSDVILFEDEGLGNYVAKELYEDVTGKEIEQQVKEVFYQSKAPLWVELIRRYKARRFLRRVEREGRTTA
jgi:Ni,Fe-hydrogenase maturation factor